MQSALQGAFNINSEVEQVQTVNVSTGEFIKQTRESKGITVTNMVKMLGNMKLSEYSSIEAEIVEPDTDTKGKIASILNLDNSEREVLLRLKMKTIVKGLNNHYSDNVNKIAARKSQ
jgi:transcriptional regulator with XRE-family HTH domain